MTLKCRLFDKNNKEWIDYNGYYNTKIDGLYGYLCVDVNRVMFFYVYNEEIASYDITHKFEIEYIIIKVK